MEFRKIVTRTAAICGTGALLGAAIPAQAASFDFGELDVSIETALSATTGVRTSSPDKDLIGKANNVPGAFAGNNVQGVYSVNGDDGNLNYDSGDFFFSRLGIISDITVSRGNFGVFLRPSYLWDPRLDDDNFADPADYGPGHERSFDDLNRKNDAVTDEVADNLELYDAYFYGRFDLFGRDASFKIGKQVLNWGESTFVQNGINSIIAANANRAFPGAEVKEIFIPTAMLWTGFNLTQNTSLELFWQLQHEETVPFATGTFFSTSDITVPGGQDVQTAFGRCDENTPGPFGGALTAGSPCDRGTVFPRVASTEPDDYNQFGGRLSFYIPALNSMELSLYAMRYNSRLPLLAGTTASSGSSAPAGSPPGTALDPCVPGTPIPGAPCVGEPGSGSYQFVYPERIELYGLSFNTYSNLLEVALQGEYSIKQGQPLNIAGTDLIMFALGLDAAAQSVAFGPCATSICKSGHASFSPGDFFEGYQRFDVHQVDLGFTRIMSPGEFLNKVGADQIALIGEVAMTYVEDLPSSSELPFGGSGDFAPNEPEGGALASMPLQDKRAYGDATSWGYRLLASLRYNSVFDVVNVVPSIRFFHDVKGTTPSPLGNFTEENKLLGLSVTVEYLDNWEFGGGYTAFFDGEESTLGQTTDSQNGTRVKGTTTNNFKEDRDFASLFVRYTF